MNNPNDLFALEFHLRNLDKCADPLVLLCHILSWGRANDRFAVRAVDGSE